MQKNTMRLLDNKSTNCPNDIQSSAKHCIERGLFGFFFTCLLAICDGEGLKYYLVFRYGIGEGSVLFPVSRDG